MNKLTVTTIRHGLNDVQLGELLATYRTDPGLQDRVEMSRLIRTGFSRKTIDQNGYKIETVVSIEKD